MVDLAKKGYDIVKDELSGSPSKRKHLEYTPPPSWTGEKSTRTDLVITPSKQSMWSKVKEKVYFLLVLCNISRCSIHFYISCHFSEINFSLFHPDARLSCI